MITSHTNTNYSVARRSSAAVLVTTLGLAFFMAGCTEKPQVAGTQPEGISHASQGGQASFNALGWTPGDKESWSDQIAQRNRYQNEYVRVKP